MHLSRQQIRHSLRARGICWREDSSNQETRFARNRIRHDLLPALERDWNPRIEATLAQTADWALAEEAYWAVEVRRLATEHFRSDPPYMVMRWPAALPLAVRRRLLRHAIELVKGDLRQIDFGHVDAILALRTGRVSVPGIIAEKSFEELRLGPAIQAASEFNYFINPPSVAHDIEFELRAADAVYTDNVQQLDWDLVPGRLHLRNWHPGDRYRRVGHGSEENIKLLFQKVKIPVWERRTWPVLVCGGIIAWSRQFGAAANMARTPQTRVVLIVRDLSNLKTRS